MLIPGAGEGHITLCVGVGVAGVGVGPVGVADGVGVALGVAGTHEVRNACDTHEIVEFALRPHVVVAGLDGPIIYASIGTE